MSGREIGLEPDGLAVLGDCLVIHPLAEKGEAQLVAGRVVIGPKPDRRAPYSAIACCTSP